MILILIELFLFFFLWIDASHLEGKDRKKYERKKMVELGALVSEVERAMRFLVFFPHSRPSSYLLYNTI